MIPRSFGEDHSMDARPLMRADLSANTCEAGSAASRGMFWKDKTMRFTRKSLGIPYAVFLLVFVAAPLLFLFYYAFTDGQGQFTMSNLTRFFTDPNTLGTLYYSFAIALATTVVCLLLAYPVAYILATSRLRRKSVILMLFIMPMWINFSLRITALKEILNVFEGNLAMYPFLNAVIGITYDFLPFMILPIYTTLSRMDGALREAAMDLGANSLQTFLHVTLPLSVPGILSGVSMVFLPAMTNYVVLDMLYNSTYIMGSLIGSYFSAYNWHGGSMISLILLAIICVSTLLTGADSGERSAQGALL